jgi:CBS domain-containing protein
MTTAAERIAAAAATGLPAPADTPVSAAMASDIVALEPGASPPALGHAMARAGVHGIVVATLRPDGSPADGPWGFVSDLDLVSGAAERPRPAVTIPQDATLVAAGRLMDRHEVSHLVVTDASGRRALGIVSALDVARHIAFGGPRR